MTSYKEKLKKIVTQLESDSNIIVEQFEFGEPIPQKELDQLWPWSWGGQLKQFYSECNGVLLIWRHKQSGDQDFIINQKRVAQPSKIGEYNVWQEERNQPTGIIQIYPLELLINNGYWKKWNQDLKKVNFDSKMVLNGQSYSIHEGYENILPFDLYNSSEHIFLEQGSGRLFRMYGYNKYYEESSFVDVDTYLDFLTNSFGLVNLRADFFNDGKNSTIDLANPESFLLSDYFDNERKGSLRELQNLDRISDEKDWVLLLTALIGEDRALHHEARAKIKEFIPLFYNEIPIPSKLLLNTPSYDRKDFLERINKQQSSDDLIVAVMDKWPSKMSEITDWYDSLLPAIDLLEKTEKGKNFLRNNLGIVTEMAIDSIKERALKFLKKENLLQSYSSFSDIPKEDPISKNIQDIITSINNFGPDVAVEKIGVVVKAYPDLIAEFDELINKEKDTNKLTNYYRLIAGQAQNDAVFLFVAKKYLQMNKNKFLFKALPNLWISSNESVALESLELTKSLGKQAKQLSPKLVASASEMVSENVKTMALVTIEAIN